MGTEEITEKQLQLDPVIAGLKNTQTQKAGVWNNLFLLAITLVLFFSTGLISAKPFSILVLIGVILLHELGHFLLMKLFRYNDVKMFFIPFLGAAVSGTNINVPQYKKAIVSLFGPLPGIILAIVLVFVVDMYSKQYYAIITTLLFLNVFNLLPFMPLDGGRYFESLFFHNRYLQLLFSIVGIVALAVVGLQLKVYALLIFILFDIFAIRNTFLISTIAAKCKDVKASSVDELLNEKPELASRLLNGLRDKFPKLFAPTAMHTVIRTHLTALLEKVNIVPPRMLTRLLYTLLYSVIVIVSLLALVIAAAMNPTVAISGSRMSRTMYGQQQSEYSIAGDGKLNGVGYHYSYLGTNRIIERVLSFSNGVLDGDVTVYTTNETIAGKYVFSKGVFITQSNYSGSNWQECIPADKSTVRLLMKCSKLNANDYRAE